MNFKGVDLMVIMGGIFQVNKVGESAKSANVILLAEMADWLVVYYASLHWLVTVAGFKVIR